MEKATSGPETSEQKLNLISKVGENLPRQKRGKIDKVKIFPNKVEITGQKVEPICNIDQFYFAIED